MECGAARRRIKDDAQERPTNNKTKWRRLIAEILVRAGSPATGSASNGVECEGRGFGRVRKVREAQPLGKICYLEPERVPECNRDYRTHRLFNVRRIHLRGPDFATLFFFFHFFHLSPFSSPSPSASFYLEAREARTTCLLEKSARLPRALINLHSARGERRGGEGIPHGLLPVLLGLMLPIECGAVNLVNSCNSSPRCERRLFNRGRSIKKFLWNGSRWRR